MTQSDKMNVVKRLLGLYLFLLLLVVPIQVFAGTVTLSLTPEHVVQGEPVLVSIVGVSSLTDIKSVTFDKRPLGVFFYNGTSTALIGVDLNQKPSDYLVIAALADGTKLQKTLTVDKRPKIEAPLGIPEKLGGNTVTSQKALVATLASENASLLGIKTGTKAFWTDAFQWPLTNVIVTDPYGYSRQTGVYSIAHKGTDFRAKEGTPVIAINRGVVRVVKEYREYGKTIVVDHGFGLMSFYMHLSKIKVNVGELIKPGQVIGLSGKTGYAEQPHLHLTIRINGTSIDPMKFFALFGRTKL